MRSLDGLHEEISEQYVACAEERGIAPEQSVGWLLRSQAEMMRSVHDATVEQFFAGDRQVVELALQQYAAVEGARKLYAVAKAHVLDALDRPELTINEKLAVTNFLKQWSGQADVSETVHRDRNWVEYVRSFYKKVSI